VQEAHHVFSVWVVHQQQAMYHEFQIIKERMDKRYHRQVEINNELDERLDMLELPDSDHKYIDDE
jgi:hypothetical protein